ncbi:MAG TPA: hypothetical protein VEG32_00240 [Clostridia bacterium]|nr:hypothetical protein [Clostridia bacterium]
MNRLFEILLHSRRTDRVIDKRTHAALDYLVTGYFFCLAGMFWGRHRRAAFTALTNAMAVMGTSMFTDYPGSLRRSIPFETHGKVDVIQAAMAMGMPALLGFSTSPAAVPFHLQAGNELLVVSATDWESRDEVGEEQLRTAV